MPSDLSSICTSRLIDIPQTAPYTHYEIAAGGGAVAPNFALGLGLGASNDRVSRGWYSHVRRFRKETYDQGCSEAEPETVKGDYYYIKDRDVKTGLLMKQGDFLPGTGSI